MAHLRRTGENREGLTSLLNKNLKGSRARAQWAGVFYVLALIILPSQSFADGDPLSIKFITTFDRFYGDAFDTPAGIFVDKKNREIYLADSGRNEVFIFDAAGTPLFRMGKASGISNPVDLVVKENRIYLAQEGNDSIDVFSYRGEDIGRVIPKEGRFSPGKMTIDNKGSIYVINKAGTNCMVFDKDDKPVGTVGEGLFSITDVAVSTDRIYLITPGDRRAVQVYDKSGRHLMSFEGLEGRGGTLGLPIAAKVDSRGLLWLLDALRGIVVYNEDGVELSRFLVSGVQRGELNFPVDMDIDDDDRLYIADKGSKKVIVFQIRR